MSSLTPLSRTIPMDLLNLTFYQIHIMGGEIVKIDPDEYELVKAAKERGLWVRLKQAEINGNSISLIKVDTERTRSYKQLLYSFENENKYCSDKEIKPFPVPQLLPDIFAHTERSAQIAERIGRPQVKKLQEPGVKDIFSHE